MNVGDHVDIAVSRIAAAIGEPARSRMLYCLMDGHARTSTELALVGEVNPSTASVHLSRLRDERLVKVVSQGRHRYYSLHGANVARALEALVVMAGDSRPRFTPATPIRLRHARTCYDHMAGTVSVMLYDRFKVLGWLLEIFTDSDNTCDLSADGAKAFQTLDIDVYALRPLRRRFAYACLDWSERKPHLGGALAAALLKAMAERKWLVQDLDSRALSVTQLGRRELNSRFELHL